MTLQRFDAIAIGSGLAGLAFALSAADRGRVCVITKAEVKDANTTLAQGGIAAAVGESDSWKLHEQDTLTAGAGMCDPAAVRFLVQEAPHAIEWLQSLGAHFTASSDGSLELGLEGGHSRNRIVHFEDRTGWEIERAVVAAVRKHPNITVLEHGFVTELIIHDGRCYGAIAHFDQTGKVGFLAPTTLLATGGCGQLYLHTTNPRVATGDGIALASQAGATIEHMEFMQFHPTTLYHQQLRGFLITEACRGAGATLRNHLGRRFMYDYDDRLELAPRDVVARSIQRELEKLSTWCVYLDMTHLKRERIFDEFPTINVKLREIGIEFEKMWIPVVPAQHYSCGGVKTDLNGRTSIPGLYAAGEVASTGVHGANRLASNSLLEALVFARSAAKTSVEDPPLLEIHVTDHVLETIPETDAIQLRRNLQRMMMDKVGIVRSNAGLKEAADSLESLMTDYKQRVGAPPAPYPLETWNLLTTAGYVINGARSRTENVGLHYNADLAGIEAPSR